MQQLSEEEIKKRVIEIYKKNRQWIEDIKQQYGSKNTRPKSNDVDEQSHI